MPWSWNARSRARAALLEVVARQRAEDLRAATGSASAARRGPRTSRPTRLRGVSVEEVAHLRRSTCPQVSASFREFAGSRHPSAGTWRAILRRLLPALWRALTARPYVHRHGRADDSHPPPRPAPPQASGRQRPQGRHRAERGRDALAGRRHRLARRAGRDDHADRAAASTKSTSATSSSRADESESSPTTRRRRPPATTRPRPPARHARRRVVLGHVVDAGVTSHTTSGGS